MKIIYSRIIPFKGFYAVNLFGIFFIRKEYENSIIPETTINHETIHTYQMKEMLYVFFYIWYFVEWFIRLFINGKNAYHNISFEREAYLNEDNLEYLSNRKKFSWLKYYGKQ